MTMTRYTRQHCNKVSHKMYAQPLTTRRASLPHCCDALLSSTNPSTADSGYLSPVPIKMTSRSGSSNIYAPTALLIQNEHIISNRYVYIHNISTIAIFLSEQWHIYWHSAALSVKYNHCFWLGWTDVSQAQTHLSSDFSQTTTLLSNSLIFPGFSSEWPSCRLFVTHCTDFKDSTTRLGDRSFAAAGPHV